MVLRLLIPVDVFRKLFYFHNQEDVNFILGTCRKYSTARKKAACPWPFISLCQRLEADKIKILAWFEGKPRWFRPILVHDLREKFSNRSTTKSNMSHPVDKIDAKVQHRSGTSQDRITSFLSFVYSLQITSFLPFVYSIQITSF